MVRSNMAVATGADGTTIHFEDHGGSGSDVVLVHGITESSQTWQPITESLWRTTALSRLICEVTVARTLQNVMTLRSWLAMSSPS